MRTWPLGMVLLACAAPLAGQQQAPIGPGGVRVALEAGLEELAAREAAWRENLAERDSSWSELFGYDPPGHALNLAALAGFLYEKEGREEDALLAAELLARMARYRDGVPAELAEARVEYADGLPAVPSFFQLAEYAEAWSRVRACTMIDADTRELVEQGLAGSADFVSVFPEWGAHNRAMLRAESLAWCARALPDHPRAPAWREMAAVLANDSRASWEIEDAALYQPIWVLAGMRYAEATGDETFWAWPQTRFYLRYFLELLTPAGHLPAFGDSWWGSSLPRLYACFAWGAAELRDPELAWGAARVLAAMGPPDPALPTLGQAKLAVLLDGHLPAGPTREPDPHSGWALDDVIAKKIVWRTGWEADAGYLCLNYRDEGDWGRYQRDYLRRTLAVEEEKMHHGNADENAVVLWMDGGSVLLHDAGYRERAPSGPYGAFRADLFHNRLVGRPAELSEGQSLLELLRDSGAYRPTRTERIDELDLEHARYARTRVDATGQGWTADRVLLALDDLRTLVVIDLVCVTRAGPYTFAPLWATQEVLGVGAGWALGAYPSVEGHALPRARELSLAFPGAGEPERFPLRRHRQPEQVLAQVASRWFDAGAREVFVTILRSVPAGANGAVEARGSRFAEPPADGVVAVELETAEARWGILVKTDLDLGLLEADVRPRVDPVRATIAADDGATDADLLLVRYAGGEEWLAAVGATFVQLGGEERFAARDFQVFQTSGRSNRVGRARRRLWTETRPDSEPPGGDR